MFKCLRLMIFFAFLAGLIFFGHSYILNRAGAFLLQKDELKPADAIVILSGEEKERVTYGVALFKEGWARKDRLIMSGGPVVWKYSLAYLMKLHAESLGVPGRDIILEDHSRTTAENAKYSRDILKRKGFRSIILVTSPYHSKRAFEIFRKVLGKGVTVISAPADKSWFSFDGWWKRSRDRDMVLSEYSKFLRFWIFGVD